jgi:hypothetical protein
MLLTSSMTIPSQKDGVTSRSASTARCRKAGGASPRLRLSESVRSRQFADRGPGATRRRRRRPRREVVALDGRWAYCAADARVPLAAPRARFRRAPVVDVLRDRAASLSVSPRARRPDKRARVDGPRGRLLVGKQANARQMVCGFCQHGVPRRALVCAACGATVVYGAIGMDLAKWAIAALAALFGLIVAYQKVLPHAPMPGWQVVCGSAVLGAAYGRWRHRSSVRFRRYLH